MSMMGNIKKEMTMKVMGLCYHLLFNHITDKRDKEIEQINLNLA